MPLIQLLVVLILIGVALYLMEMIPMDATIKRVIWIVVIVFVILWVIQSMGLLEMGPVITFRR